MKLWKENKNTPCTPFYAKQKQASAKGEREIVRKSGGFYNPEGGRSRDGYLHSPENRQIAIFTLKE